MGIVGVRWRGKAIEVFIVSKKSSLFLFLEGFFYRMNSCDIEWVTILSKNTLKFVKIIKVSYKANLLIIV